MLNAALVFNRPALLAAHVGYTLAQALDRVGAKWLALIPEASRQLDDEAAEAADRVELERAEAMLTGPTSTDELTFSTSLITYSEAPGYRDVSFTFDMVPDGSKQTYRARIRTSPEDAESIVQHLQHVHRFAWRDPDRRPMDANPDERRPKWVDGLS